MAQFNELSKQTASAIAKQTKHQIFASGNWELSSKNVGKMALPTSTLYGSEESFFKNSQILGAMLENINTDEISTMDLINLVMAADAIENANTKAATFVRDTGGGKPIEKVQKQDNVLNNLTDDELNRILESAKVVDNGQD